eukprot:scaffold11522_cov239-Ochromonas_danica.AAC.11
MIPLIPWNLLSDIYSEMINNDEKFRKGLEFLEQHWSSLCSSSLWWMGKLEIRCNTARTSYAVIPVAISSAIPLSSNRDVSFDDDEDYDSLNISSEACCLPPCREVIEGELTIALQPTYLVPCPYLRLWKQNGEMVTLEALQMLLARFSTSSQSLSEVVDDSRRYQWGQWLPEVHPVLDQSCLGLHACDVGSVA